jgi:hypothetical protein
VQNESQRHVSDDNSYCDGQYVFCLARHVYVVLNYL